MSVPRNLTWQLDNVIDSRRHFGQSDSVQHRTPPLWVRWPETWRQPTRPTPAKVGLICSDPIQWTEAVEAFERLGGHALTEEKFDIHVRAAYGFALRHRWSGLPDNASEAIDVKSAALAEAYCGVIEDYALARRLIRAVDAMAAATPPASKDATRKAMKTLAAIAPRQGRLE
jgi:hypothetical protein